MRTLLTFLLVGVLSGCASVPPNPWADLEQDTTAATEPLDCVMPLPDRVEGQSIVYDSAVPLEEYRVCSEANQQIAGEHVETIDQLQIANAGLIEAGKAQHNIAAMKQEMLEDERRHHAWQTVGFILMIIGAAVL